MLVKTPDDFVNWLTDLVAKDFPGPRLKNPQARIQERAAALRLCEAGYKASRIKSIWFFSQGHNFFASKINSVQALAAALLEPPNPNWLEADYDVWLKEHPPRCPHGKRLDSGPCPECYADKNCLQCRKKGTVVAFIGPKQYAHQFICDCAAPKMGLPSLAEQIKTEEKKSA